MLEVVAALVTLVSIALATRESLWYYPTGIASVLAYGFVYLRAAFYAEAALQLVWLALMLYGWHHWLRGGAANSELPVGRTPARGWMVVVASAIVVTAAVWAAQLRWTDNPAPLLDSSIAAWSIAAQWMTARKWLESWLVWVAINSVAVPLYVWRGLAITAALYAVLWVLGIVGYRQWRTSLASS